MIRVTNVIEPKGKFWLEYGDHLAMSDYRLQLLESIDETGSLAEAAQRMELSYRRAWGKVRDLENNLDMKLVESFAGGAGGGGSRLTSEGRDMIQRYKEFTRQSRHAIEEIFETIFLSAAGPPRLRELESNTDSLL